MEWCHFFGLAFGRKNFSPTHSFFFFRGNEKNGVFFFWCHFFLKGDGVSGFFLLFSHFISFDVIAVVWRWDLFLHSAETVKMCLRFAVNLDDLGKYLRKRNCMITSVEVICNKSF